MIVMQAHFWPYLKISKTFSVLNGVQHPIGKTMYCPSVATDDISYSKFRYNSDDKHLAFLIFHSFHNLIHLRNIITTYFIHFFRLDRWQLVW